MLCRTRRTALTLLAVLAVAPGAGAQESMRDMLAFLVTNHTVETADFDRDRAAADAAHDTISRALVVALATMPLTSSSGGFTYAFNPALGTVERSSLSFSPFFVERAPTSGLDQGSVGATWRLAHFSRLQGHDLRDGSFITVANRFTDEPGPFDEESLTLDIRARTLTMFGTYGISDRLEIGAVVPFVQMEMHGRRVNTYRGRSLMQAEVSARTSGLGDVAVRTKYRILDRGGLGLAAAADLHLPTGREADLLGAGRAAVTMLGIASMNEGRTAMHLNVGVARGGVSNEVRLGAAVAVAATPGVTLTAELLGRYLDALERIAPVAQPHPRMAGVETIRVLPEGPGTRALLGVTGVKWNVAGAWLLTGHVLWALTDTGLTAPAIPAVALDYSF